MPVVGTNFQTERNALNSFPRSQSPLADSFTGRVGHGVVDKSSVFEEMWRYVAITQLSIAFTTGQKDTLIIFSILKKGQCFYLSLRIQIFEFKLLL